jgi:predicted nucleic acid-binding protein
MIAVLDASAAMEILLDKEEAGRIRSALTICEKTIAPSLFFAEVANALRNCVAANVIDESEAVELLRMSEGLIHESVAIKDNSVESLHEAIRLKHSVYDMLYLTLARRNAAAIITLDQRLNKISEHEGIVILIKTA